MPISVGSLLRLLGPGAGSVLIYAANLGNPEAQTADDKTSALKHFMDVYGSNIDYRDVAERIRALKS